MDIDIDQSVPRNDLKLEEGGKYIYKINNKRDEVDKFNRDFEQYIDRRKMEMKRKMDEKLETLNKPIAEIPIYNQSIGDILIKTKDSIFDILDDLLQSNFNNILIKDNRLFHIGIIILCVTILLFTLYTFTNASDPVNKKDIKIALTFENIKQSNL